MEGHWTLLKLVRIFAVVSVCCGSSPHFVYREDWKERGCSSVLSRVRTQMVAAPKPLDISGEWVSSRCEIRSGPEYVVRHVSFLNNSFHSIVYHFSDPDCNQPYYAIQSHGVHKLEQASWTVRGATESSYEIRTSYVIPYTHNATREISQKLAVHCKDKGANSLTKPYSRHLIYSLLPRGKKAPKNSAEARDDKDCFHALNFSLHELQLVALEMKRHHRPHHPHHHRIPHQLVPLAEHKAASNQYLTKELLLGAVHSKPGERLKHRPSSFQTALKDATTPGCGMCSRILSSSPLYPPRLSIHTGTLLSLEGEWVSTRCESRQYGMFLTRWLHFLPDGASWQGQYDYYHDNLCQHPSFSLNAKGSYVGGTSSHLVHGAKDFSFKVTRLKVTPHDLPTVNSLNHYSGKGCGKAHAWSVGREQDVTWTGGCVTLGIRLPNMERDIMKMEIVHRKLHLFVGQRLVDRKPGTAYQHERPTAFQEPLVKCDKVDLDMSINTAPGGHSWAGAVALPLFSKKQVPPEQRNFAMKHQATISLTVVMLVIRIFFTGV